MNAELITIGAELLQGKTLNTNAQFLSQKISSMNFKVTHHTVCDDDAEQIKKCLALAMSRSQLIIVTGGLGPTPDDVTREAISDYFQSRLVFDSRQYRFISKFFKKIGKRPSPITKRECFFPEAGRPILNQYGIALGFYVKSRGRLVVCLPGVPREMIGLFNHHVGRIVLKFFGRQIHMHQLDASLMGIDEAGAMRKFPKNFFANPHFSFGSYPMDGRLVFRFKSKDAKVISNIKRVLKANFLEYIYSFSDVGIEEVVGALAQKRNKTIALAESCTGGIVGKRITDIAGASRFFLGSVVTYSNKAKENILGVSEDDLKKFGAVSNTVATQMASKVRQLLNSNIGLSITGIAGPGGGSKEKPVGLVWIAISDAKKARAFRFQFAGNRERIRRLASDRAFWLLYEELR